ncbi:hypothetical protein PI95_032310 [Hassallia byssoidea VB512170]|uniref:Uncharacterized protein n=1 Tax=Hassallia byssoidea VB512170 TaxID=1304833 RepID=A0A846HJL0_9CYAN|nr:hypothetical protein [Hassalia byssoidea]NEU77058.1 hypothetical protein [Hassalia byssoidea VB512170]
MSDIWIPDSPSQLRFLPKPTDFLRGLLPYVFKIILSEPLFLPTKTGNEKRYQRLLEVHQQNKQQRNRAWNFIAQHNLPQYIWMIGEFPDPLLPVIPSDKNEEDLILGFKHAYQSIQIWLFDLTGCKEPRPIWWKPTQNYKPWAELFVAQLQLATAVYNHHQPSNLLHQLFASPEHLWFWCQVAICRRNLRESGLGSPLPHTKVIGKQDLMERWNKANQMRKDFEETLSKGIVYPNKVDWFEHLDYFLEGEAMQIADVEASWNKRGGAWLEYRKAQERGRDTVRHEKELQLVSLYQFPDDTETRIHLTGLHQKLPKPPKKIKRGFDPKR